MKILQKLYNSEQGVSLISSIVAVVIAVIFSLAITQLMAYIHHISIKTYHERKAMFLMEEKMEYLSYLFDSNKILPTGGESVVIDDYGTDMNTDDLKGNISVSITDLVEHYQLLSGYSARYDYKLVKVYIDWQHKLDDKKNKMVLYNRFYEN